MRLPAIAAIIAIVMLSAIRSPESAVAQVAEETPTVALAMTPTPVPIPAVTDTPTVAVPPTVVTFTPVPPVPEETGTPVATIYVPPPLATEPPARVAATDVVPTATARPTDISIPKPRPTLAPTEVVFPSSTPLPTPTEVPVPIRTRVTVVPTVPSLPSAPLPSPAQLKASAQFEFGHGIPHAVRQWAFIIVPLAKKYGISPLLVAAVITMESGGDPLAWNSGSDARGLMQILHGPWDPRQNIRTGIAMLAQLHQEFGRWDLALAGYNAGPNAVIAYGGVPPYRETRDYVIVVQYLWDLYGNHPLNVVRKKQYTATLTDLAKFKSVRKRVVILAKAGQVRPEFSLSCTGDSCDTPAATTPAPSLDPFWPVGSIPDPLQKVSPK